MADPNGLAITSDGNTAWVADASGGKLWPINNLQVTPTLGTAVTGMTVNGPYGVVLTPDGNTAWVPDNTGGETWPINNLKTAPSLGTAVTGMGHPIAIAIYGSLNAVATQAQSAPINPTFGSVYSSSLTVNWGGVSSANGYSVEGSTGALPNSLSRVM